MNKYLYRHIYIVFFLLAAACFVNCSNNPKVKDVSVKNQVVKDTVRETDGADSEKAEAKVQNKKDPVVGVFVCRKTNDKYVFNDDGTGYFFTGGSNTEFKWQHKDDIVILTYEVYGKEYLLFDPKKRTLKEDSETLGVLIFNKI